MGFVLADQTRAFLFAAVLGLALGALYDLLRCLRSLFGLKAVGRAVLDFLYCFLCMGGYFALALACWGGVIRYYTLLGTAGGIFLYFCGLSQWVYPILMLPVRLVRWVLQGLAKILLRVGRVARRVGEKLFAFDRGN